MIPHTPAFRAQYSSHVSGMGLTILLLIAALGCAEVGNLLSRDSTEDTESQTGDSETASLEDTDTNVIVGCDKMDILFVIDDSGSMQCEQSTLAQAFPEFISVLETYATNPEHPVTYRVAVTATSKTMSYILDLPPIFGVDFPPIPYSEAGMDGNFAPNPTGGDSWLEGPGNSSMATSFSAMAQIGTGGTSYEMPLEMLRTALSKTGPEQSNGDFLRPDSLFIVVVITDEDDCSRSDTDFTIPNDRCMDDPVEHNLNDLADYKDYLDTKFGGEDRYVLVSIAGAQSCDGNGYAVACGDDQDGASHAERLQDFTVNYIGTGEGFNGVFSDICTVPLPDALTEALDKMEVACDEYETIIE